MNIRLFSEHDGPAWENYVWNSPHATLYHRIGWKDVIEKTFGHQTQYLLAEGPSGRLQGILPLVQMKSFLFGNFMVSLPYFNYGGICADTEDARSRLFSAAVQKALNANAKHIELRETCTPRNGIPVKTTKVSMQMILPRTTDELWRSFPSKLRSQVQRPMRDGMYARLGREESIDDFYAVFSENMRDLGTPVYSKEFFRNILKHFPECSWICSVCTKERRPVAAGLLLGFKDRIEIPWASSLRKFNRYSPNMLLYWSALRVACEKGYRIFDFGRSTPGEGTYKFKQQWGAQPVQLFWHYWLRNGHGVPELNPSNPKFRIAILVWKKLPVTITNAIGPSIVKNLP